MKDNYDYEPSGNGLIIVIIALIVIYMIVKVLL
jgi:hypothetical protein